MKNLQWLMGIGLVSLLVGCSSTPVALAPVGPDPPGMGAIPAQGELRVFSSLVGRSEGNNPPWYQHSAYELCDLQGRPVKRVYNTVARYSPAPRSVALPPGKYLVRARARDYSRVEVPVTIERGRTTTIHLDDNWSLPPDVSLREVVSLPNGRPVGWRAESAKPTGIN